MAQPQIALAAVRDVLRVLQRLQRLDPCTRAVTHPAGQRHGPPHFAADDVIAVHVRRGLDVALATHVQLAEGTLL